MKLQNFFEAVEDIVEAKKGSDYKIYHGSYSAAIEEFLNYVKTKGYEVSDDEVFSKISSGSKRPKVGTTTRIDLELTKNDNPSKIAAHAQIYGMENDRYELNVYLL